MEKATSQTVQLDNNAANDHRSISIALTGTARTIKTCAFILLCIGFVISTSKSAWTQPVEDQENNIKLLKEVYSEAIRKSKMKEGWISHTERKIQKLKASKYPHPDKLNSLDSEKENLREELKIAEQAEAKAKHDLLEALKKKYKGKLTSNTSIQKVKSLFADKKKKSTSEKAEEKLFKIRSEIYNKVGEEVSRHFIKQRHQDKL